MADEIINELGFDVSKALSALEALDRALRATGASFNAFGATLDAFNGRAQAALATMRGLASAAGRMSSAMQSAGNGTTPPVAPAQSSQSLWLPSGFASQAQQAAQAMTQVGQAGQAAGQNVNSGMNQAGSATKGARQEADRLVVSWNTISRVVMTQTIVRAMSEVRDLLKESVQSAIQFQRNIAEIRTIAPQVGGDFQSIASETAEFSKNFNIPLPQVTEGLYETISNQFASMSDRANIMHAAMKLSRVAVMDFQDATRLLTSTLNAYGMASNEADRVTSQFFTTINLGQVRGKELADTIGQVIPIASQLGITLEEVNAAVVSLTIGGLDIHKATTGLRAAMTGLLKPSEDMQKVLRSLGFTSAEQIIQAKGLQGALEAVASASDDMASEIGKSFRNVRALTAELRLTQTGAKQARDALEAMERSTPDALNKIFEQFRNTDAERLTAEINRLKTELTQDFGNALTNVLASIMRLMGGADNLSAAIQAIAAAAVPAAAAMMGLAAAFVITHTAMGPIGWGLLAITAAAAAFAGAMTYSTASAINDIRRLAAEEQKATVAFVKSEEEKLRAIREAERKANEQANRDWENRASVIRKDYFKALDELKERNQALVDSDRATMQSMISTQEKVVVAYRNAANECLRIIQQSRQRQASAEAQYADTVFKSNRRNLDVYKRIENLRLRSQDLARQANRALGGAATEDQVQAALAVQQRAEAAAQEAQSLADSTGFLRVQTETEQNLLGIYRQKIAAEKRLQEMAAQRADADAKRAAAEQARLDRMKVAMKNVLDALEVFDKGKVKTPQQLAQGQEFLKENLAQLQKEWLGGQQISIADMLGMDKLTQRVQTAVEGGVRNVEVQRLFSSNDTYAQFRREIERGVGPIQVLISKATAASPQLAEELKGATAEEAVGLLSQRLQESTRMVDTYRQMADKVDVANKSVQRVQQEAAKKLDDWMSKFGEQEALPLGDRMLQFNFPEKYKQITDSVLNFAQLAEQYIRPGAQIKAEDFQALNDAYQKYIDTIKPSPESKALLETFIQKAAMISSQATDAESVQKGMQQIQQDAMRAQQEIPALRDALRAAEEGGRNTAGVTGEAANNASAAATNVGNMASINMSGLVGQIGQAALNMWSLARAAASVEMPSGSEYVARGGMMRYFDQGGFVPKGPDTIPAMLSKGEFVMNSRSTRRFYSQLVAMNAGVAPTFRSQGGEVGNITVGDININGVSQPRENAREVINAMKREFRRGTSRL